MASPSPLDELQHFIHACPVVDNHAHNLLRTSGQKTGNFLSITSEATRDATADAKTTLPHLRAAKQLRKLYDLPHDADWDAILKKRAELLDTDADALYTKCFDGTQTILVDDGLTGADTIEPYSWHDKYTRSPCKRIVRIETVAADILSALHQQNKLPVGAGVADEEACSLAWLGFVTAFEQAIVAFIDDPDVVGFKSVVCYRTGLDVRVGRDIEVTQDGLRSFRRHFLPECVSRNFRVETKGMNDALVISTCKLIAAGYRQRSIAKPLQFHTGLGDNDISLLDSNPACLQPLIKQFPSVPIVLLHSSYPYTREAGYLATVYKNCFLDIGEVFPMVSRDGQEKILREAFEITPWSKLLWSTDGHFYPETYWLANIQGRAALEKVLCEYVEVEDLTVQDAIKAAKDFFFENSNWLYSLGLAFDGTGQPPALPERPEDSSIAKSTAEDDSPPFMTPLLKIGQYDMQPSSRYKDAFQKIYTPFIDAFPDTDYLFVQWLDYMGLLRTRCLPIEEFSTLIKMNRTIRISNGNLGTLQNDHMTDVCNPVGSIEVEPDSTLESLRCMSIDKEATVMAQFTDEGGEAHPLCPRAQLGELVKIFRFEYAIDFLIGFEIEITFCKRDTDSPKDSSSHIFSPLDTTHAWGTFTDEQHTSSFGLVLNIASALRSIGIAIEQVHSEAGAGQYEYVLPPLPPLHAIDTLIQARQCIQQMAANKGLRATCHPQPFPGIGTAAHAHISFNPASVVPTTGEAEIEKLQMSFMAAVLEHLPALCAFTMPQAVSYARVVDDSWTGGTWIAWGTENREVPLRKSGTTRWEVRCLDGCANMYLALVAILSAGLAGIQGGQEMKMLDCRKNPTKLSDAEKQELGIINKLPTTIEDALEAATKDTALAEAMPPGMLNHFVVMKKAEQAMLKEMDDAARRIWLMERY